MAEHGSPLEHVMDHPTIEIPGGFSIGGVGPEIHLPTILGFQVTRFMVMEVVAAILIMLIVIPLARHVARNKVTRGPFWNLFEALFLFIRDGIARPSIGQPGPDHSHEFQGDASIAAAHGHQAPHAKHYTGDDFVPFLATLFFFLVFCNLLGMIPGGASPTGNINVTGVLAVLTFGTVVVVGSRVMGPVGYWLSIVPPMDVPKFLKPILWGLMFFIEVMGLLIKHAVLSVRLFANMLAGHIVLVVILGFTLQAVGLFTYVVTPLSMAGVVALSLLELFVAILQAYIFTFLSALFIGSAVHPH
jgi:F-type H+-transporting ATPase subunit a